jgi:hypothetical protein
MLAFVSVNVCQIVNVKRENYSFFYKNNELILLGGI